jgi:hypothetical protein
MPTRLLNINAMAYGAVLFGLIGVHRTRLWSSILLVLLAGGLLLGRESMLWNAGLATYFSGVRGWLVALPVLAAVTIGLVVLRSVPPSPVSPVADSAGWARSFPLLFGRLATLALLTFAAVHALGLKSQTPLLDRTNQPFFAFVGQDRSGLLATAGDFHLVQLLTRRPVLLNSGALDTISYAPESGPAMYRALRDVYGIDLLQPPRQVARGLGAIPHGFNRPVWESFSREKWRNIRRDYNVTQVLTEVNYELALPVAAQFRNFKLYDIPE